MSAAPVRGGRKPASLRTIWAIAKSPELGMDEDTVHALVFRETGKASLRDLSQGQIETVVRVLQRMKDSTGGTAPHKRTDEGGNQGTTRQRRMVYILTKRLGWRDDNTVNGLIKKMFGIERIEWLTPPQCEGLIEALKAMVGRREPAQ